MPAHRKLRAVAATVGATFAFAASASAQETPATAALAWNATAVDAVRAARVVDPPGIPPRPIYQTEGLLYMSYVQAAVYDAVTAIAGRYRAYHAFGVGDAQASVPAAVAAAAHDTLVFYLGDPDGSLAAKYAAALAALPSDDATARGIAVGHAAAADIEALRAQDGRDAPAAEDFGVGPLAPGRWLFAPPPSLQSAQTPWMATMQPFTLRRADQFLAPPPPRLESRRYARDFAETKAYGAIDSAVRTPEQTAIAYFWNANAINQVNQTLRDVAVQHGMDLIDTVRLLAAGDLVTTDAGLACMASKYRYLRWRPVTAIRNADIDGNPATAADAGWTPLVATPNHPEYPSQHGCVNSALAEVLAHLLGARTIDVTVPGAQGGATTITTAQTFATVADLDTQLVDARVWIGFHFRTSVLAGETLGRSVARWALRRAFTPLRPPRR